MTTQIDTPKIAHKSPYIPSTFRIMQNIWYSHLGWFNVLWYYEAILLVLWKYLFIGLLYSQSDPDFM